MKTWILALALLLGFKAAGAQGFEYNVLKAWNIDRSRSSDGFFQFFSNNNTVFIVGVPAAMAIDGFISDNKKLRQAALEAGLSLGISSAIALGLKYTINRPRPFTKYPDVVKLSDGGSPSFPSGHTSSAFSVAASVSLSYPKWYVIVPSFLWAGTVGVSRIALGVHYPSDVLAGAAIGIGSAYLGRIGNKWLQGKIKSRKGSPNTARL
jgi:membrane-associated phospholipid phosphatase